MINRRQNYMRDIVSHAFLISLTATLFFGCARKAEIQGTVFDNFGKPIAGATVKIENAAFVAVTDKDGKYCISYVPGNIKLIVAKNGYSTDSLSLTIATESVYPAKAMTLFKAPPGMGIFAVSESGYVQIPQVEIHCNSRRRPGNKYGLYFGRRIYDLVDSITCNLGSSLTSLNIPSQPEILIATPGSFVLYRILDSKVLVAYDEVLTSAYGARDSHISSMNPIEFGITERIPFGNICQLSKLSEGRYVLVPFDFRMLKKLQPDDINVEVPNYNAVNPNLPRNLPGYYFAIKKNVLAK